MRCYRSALRACGEAIEVLESRQLLSVTPVLLADINTEQSSFPSDFVEFNGKLFYTTEHADYGRELWSSDGTPEGTHLVKDIRPGVQDSGVSGFTVSGDWLYFAADDGVRGRELWRTDGTAEGTQLFHEFNVGLGSKPEMVDAAGTLFLKVGSSLWKVDDSEANAVQVTSISTAAANFTAVGGLLYFTGASDELWKSDGTAEGTTLVKDLNVGSIGSDRLQELTAFDDRLFFIVNSEVWKSDGTAAGTVKVQASTPFRAYSSESLTVAGDKLFIAARMNDGSNANDILVVADADAAAVRTHIPTNFAFDSQMTPVGDVVFYRASHAGGGGLWKTDGTSEGTEFLSALEGVGFRYEIRNMTDFNGELFFVANNGVDGPDLWRSNGTPEGTLPWRSRIALPRNWDLVLGVAGGKLFFTSNGGGTGLELWRTDGTDEGTLALQDLPNVATDSSLPSDFVATGTHVYFVADNGFGRQLFSTSDPSGPVTQLTPSRSGLIGSQVEQLTPVGNLLYFVAVDENGRYLGVTDGTLVGTQRLDWPFAEGELTLQELTVYGLTEFEGGVIFLLHDATVGTMVASASTAGIEIVHVLGTAIAISETDPPVLWQGDYVFIAAETTGKEIWRTDGTSAGTQRLRDTASNLGPYSRGLTATSSLLYFISAETAESPSRLWRTDGTAAGSFAYETLAAPLQLKAGGEILYFTTSGPMYPFGRLWSTDGSISGTQELGEHRDPTFRYLEDAPLNATEFAGVLYYFGPHSSTSPIQMALWRSDGTPEGTVRVVDLPEDYSFSRTGALAVVGDKLIIRSHRMTYESDGTAIGTSLLFDGIVAIATSDNNDALVRQIARLGDTLYFAANHNQSPGVFDPYGSEPSYGVPDQAKVAARSLFYNDSAFDGQNSGLDSNDRSAIATDKQAYLPGTGPATFANISSYVHGINGLILQIEDLPDNLFGPLVTLDDFVFRVGGNNELGSWTAVPAPNQIAFEKLDGFGWNISLSWESGAIKNTWLEVTMLANERTGLTQPDVFYFGSRVGDTGSGTAAAATTTAADALLVRENLGLNQWITNAFDFDRDGIVSAADVLIARSNTGILRKLDLPAPVASSSLVAADPITTPLAAKSQGSSAAKSVSHGELLAFVMQSWHEWLDDGQETSELVGQLLATGKRRR